MFSTGDTEPKTETPFPIEEIDTKLIEMVFSQTWAGIQFVCYRWPPTVSSKRPPNDSACEMRQRLTTGCECFNHRPHRSIDISLGWLLILVKIERRYDAVSYEWSGRVQWLSFINHKPSKNENADGIIYTRFVYRVIAPLGPANAHLQSTLLFRHVTLGSSCPLRLARARLRSRPDHRPCSAISLSFRWSSVFFTQIFEGASYFMVWQ